MAGEDWSSRYFSLRFVFSPSEDLVRKVLILEEHVEKDGFLPVGLYERFVVEVLNHSQNIQMHSSARRIILDDSVLRKSLIIPFFGSQRFRIQKQGNSLLVDIEGDSPVAVYKRLVDLIQRTLDKSSIYLFFAAFVFTNGNPAELYSLKEVIRCSLNKTNFVSIRRQFSFADLVRHFRAWFPNLSLQEIFDLMCSYRWETFDSELTALIYDKLTLCTVTSAHRAIRVYLDVKSKQGLVLPAIEVK